MGKEALNGGGRDKKRIALLKVTFHASLIVKKNSSLRCLHALDLDLWKDITPARKAKVIKFPKENH